MTKTTIIIKDADIPVRKKQPPPGKPIADPKAYRRRPKHKRRDDAAHDEETPGGESPPGVSSSLRVLQLLPTKILRGGNP
jgi:hypothetical protein